MLLAPEAIEAALDSNKHQPAIATNHKTAEFFFSFCVKCSFLTAKSLFWPRVKVGQAARELGNVPRCRGWSPAPIIMPKTITEYVRVFEGKPEVWLHLKPRFISLLLFVLVCNHLSCDQIIGLNKYRIVESLQLQNQIDRCKTYFIILSSETRKDTPMNFIDMSWIWMDPSSRQRSNLF